MQTVYRIHDGHDGDGDGDGAEADTEFFYFQPSACGGLNCYCHDCYRSVTGRQPGQRRNIRQEETANVRLLKVGRAQ